MVENFDVEPDHLELAPPISWKNHATEALVPQLHFVSVDYGNRCVIEWLRHDAPHE